MTRRGSGVRVPYGPPGGGTRCGGMQAAMVRVYLVELVGSAHDEQPCADARKQHQKG